VVPHTARSRLSPPEAWLIVLPRRAMSAETLCTQCDRQEWKCDCDRFCWMCQGQDNIKMGEDGRFYCPECREACDVGIANPDSRVR
jgi:hypothetical protein